jgi:outer membrane protein assembly factor BamB
MTRLTDCLAFPRQPALALALILTLTAGVANAADWPQWQGPDRNAVSKETGLLKEWPKDGPPLAWKIADLGGGYSAPSVAAGRIFGMSNRGDYQVVWALSEADGTEQWAMRVGPAVRQGMRQGIEGPGSTPTVDGELLYVVGHGGDLACLQARDGKIVWQKNLVRDFGGRLPTWRFNESPLVDGDKVICTPGGADAMLVALNKLTGETIWKTQVPGAAGGPGGAAGGADGPGRGPGGAPGGSGRPGGPGGPGGGRGGRGGPGGGGSGAAYSSAIAIDFEGQRQYVQLTAKALIGVAASDGKLLWQYDKPANRMGINISTPLYHDGMIFASSAYGAGGGLVKLSKGAGGAIKAEEVYLARKMQNHHGGMVVVDGALYAASGGNEGGFLVCLDFKTGNVLWDERDSGQRRATKGSVALADGRIYYRTEEGAMLLIEPNPKQYTERGRFEQPDRTQQPGWSHPVIANGKMYLRDQDVLFCYDVKAK